MERNVNTYQGLNMDTAYDTIQPNFYIDALDIRISTDTGESIGGWTNIKGNQQSFVIPSSGFFNGSPWTASNPEIIGYTTIRNRIIIFVADDSDAKGWIYDVQYNTATRDILPGFPVLKYYNGALNFEKNWPIEALGRYETDCVQRVYWTDYNNYFRTINLEDPDLATTPVGNIDIFPDLEYSQPLLKVISSGALATGEYQVAYRLITADGKETLIAPPGNLIHIVSDSESLPQSAQYNGDGPAVNSGKAIQIDVDVSTYVGTFKEIEFIVVYHETLNATPNVLSIEKQTLTGSPTATFIYTGNEGTAFPIELLTFTTKNHPFKTPKTITQKDSSLVIANIKGSSISVQDLLESPETFDARTARYLNDGTSLPHPLTGTPEEIETKKLKNAFNSSVDATTYPTRPTIGFNQDAHWDDDWQNNKQFKYKSDGATLGGEGPNISYKFHLEPFTLDGDNPTVGFANVSNTPDFVFTHNFNDGYGTYTNTTFPNFASPFLSGLMRGYKRGETYRFGIIFYTLKGEATFVEYIGDIKFPDISEADGTNNSSESAYWPLCRKGNNITGASNPNDTIGFSLGIEFTIDLSSCPSLLNQITGYQIVRVKREEQDRRRYSQGFVKGFYYHPITSPGFPSDFDLRGPGNAENVVHLYPRYPDAAASPNGSFMTLEDQEHDPSLNGLPIYYNYLIKGQYLGFYSPELSFSYEGARTNLPTLAANPCLLITGSYASFDVYPTSFSDFIDLSGIGLGEHSIDIRNIVKDTDPVTFNSKENIKKWANVSLQLMPDDSDYTQKVTSNFDGYYMRNYYALDNFPEAGSPGVPPTLNNPQNGTGNSDAPQLYKAGSSIIGNITKISTDFFTQESISPSAYDWFKAPLLVHPLSTTNGSYSLQFPIMDYVLPRIETYGGFTKDALENNSFIIASPVISTNNLVANTHTFRVFGGDIFINMFTAQPGTVEFNTGFYGNNKYRQDNSLSAAYPVESIMNLELAYGATLRTGVTYTFGTQTLTILRQENDNTTTTYGKTAAKMYAYNSVNSRENSDVTFFVEPANAKDCKVNDIRAYLSNIKYNDETIDSWTKFGTNNFYDVDDYGPINKILNYKDYVYFVQDRAFGAYAINRAAITTTADGVPTALGTGQGFGKHQYHSKTHGSIHQWGVKSTDTGIYIFDALSRKIFMFAASTYQAQNSPLSEITGIHSWLRNLPDAIFLRKKDGGDNPILRKGMTIAKDSINDEIIFTFLGTGLYEGLNINTTYPAGTLVFVGGSYYLVTTTFTTTEDPKEAFSELVANSEKLNLDFNPIDKSIVYDELMTKFSSRYSTTPKIWLENSDILMSPNPTNSDVVYTHNIGNWGEFYGSQRECSLTLVLNFQADINKILRTLEFNSIVRDDNKTVDRTKTITAFEITTEYQSTGKVPFSADRIMRKFDKWRVKIPRNQLSVSKQDRLRSTHFVLTLYFDNLDNKEIICNRLMSYYDFQIF